ncbi:MAG TPA: hypothetical protein VNH83_21490 [Bryobacteraceae bacterium]|nr:hypothetical protein [Bryobacteraceae bacterium]
MLDQPAREHWPKYIPGTECPRLSGYWPLRNRAMETRDGGTAADECDLTFSAFLVLTVGSKAPIAALFRY